MFRPDLPGHLIAGKPLSTPALILDALHAQFEAFVCGVYHRRPHGSTGEPPVTRWQKGGFLPAMPDSLEQVEAVYDPRDLTEIHVYHERRVIRRALSHGHAGHPSLRAIQRARRSVRERDKKALATTEASIGGQENTAPQPTTYRGLRLYAADD